MILALYQIANLNKTLPMTTFEIAVTKIAQEVYKMSFQQITIDLIQDKVEELLGNRTITSEDVGSVAYEAGIILEVFNPIYTKDIDLLYRLKKALNAWASDIESTNSILGLPKQS